MRTGDAVYHKPTGETWVVAFCENGEVVPMGWPLCWAKESDCVVTEAASEDVHAHFVNRLRAMPDQSDPRARWAKRTHPAPDGEVGG